MVPPNQTLIAEKIDIVVYSNLPVPQTMAEMFERFADAQKISLQTAQRMKKAVGLRNILVHEYRKVDWNILWSVIANYMVDFQSFVSEIHASTCPAE